MTIFGVSYFDKEEKPEKGEKPQLLDEGDHILIEKGKEIVQKELEQERQQETLVGGRQ